MPIKLFHIQLLPIMSGVQKAMMDILINLDRKKYKITVLCKEEGEMTDVLEQHGIDFITVPNLVRKVNFKQDLRALKDITKILAEKKPDIVHTHSSKSGVIGRIAAFRAGVPVIFHTIQGFSFHQFSSYLAKVAYVPIERFASKYADLHLSVNQFDLEYAVEHHIIPKDKIVRLYNGIDLSKSDEGLKESELKQKMNIPKDALIVTQVGRLWDQKAPEIFVRTAIKTLEQNKNIYFLLVGDGELRPKLESIIHKHGLEKHIRILGWRKDVDRLLGITDVFMLTSLWEGLSVAILEAMAYKLPIIASNIKGNNELLVSEESGYLCEPNDISDFYSKLSLLIKDRGLMTKIGEAGFSRASELFSIEKTVSEIDQLYQTYYEKKVNAIHN